MNDSIVRTSDAFENSLIETFDPGAIMNETELPTIIVAGDVCIDWLSIPVEPVVMEDSATPNNWQLRGGRHMYSRRGGAWLTGDFTECAVSEKASVCKPEERGQLSAIPPDELIHSMLLLDSFPRQRNRKTERVWGVREFEGFAGPADGKLIRPPPRARCEDPNVAIVVLDDAGNGFRDDTDLWPEALKEDRKPIVIYKVRRPLLQGPLWKRLSEAHLGRTIAVLNANELRADGALISRRLSWERTATDLVLALEHDPTWKPLKQCSQIVVPFGLEGVIHLSRPDDAVAARLWYVPGLIENDLLHPAQGDMAGFASAFTAALAAEIAARLPKERLSSPTIAAGIDKGILAMRYLLDRAFGACTDDKGRRKEPVYPGTEIFGHREFPGFRVHQVNLPPVPSRSDLAGIGKFRDWRILDATRSRPIRELATEIAVQGLDRALPELPVARFGALETIDRWEIESYRSIRNLILEFLKNPKPERPLCLAVFGRPGSGKSFGVTEVAKSVADKDIIEKFDFNLSQWENPGDLAVALHRVRDSALRGKVPLVFFDEFDSTFRVELGWFKYFLAPMQDGVFSDGNFFHLIGRAIFVFAGGTRGTFEEFRELAKDQKPDIKAQDFLSRLRGRVDVFGADPLADASILRRAMLLRSLLERKYPLLFDGKKRLRIHAKVLVAFLNVPEYRHGIRSLEALLEMSQLQARDQFDPSMLPPLEQLQLHVDGYAFTRIVQSPVLLGQYLEELAKSIHQHYVQHELAKATDEASRSQILARPSAKEWRSGLDQIYRDSNRDQAAHIPVKLASIDCDLAPLGDGETPDNFKFEENEIQLLAEMEHERWIEERRLKQPNNPALAQWKALSPEMKEKDMTAIQDLPEVLADAKLKIVRVKRSGLPSAQSGQVEEPKHGAP